MSTDHDTQSLEEFKEYMRKKVDDLTSDDTVIFAFVSPANKDCRVTFIGSLASLCTLTEVVTHSVAEELGSESSKLASIFEDADQDDLNELVAPTTRTLQ